MGKLKSFDAIFADARRSPTYWRTRNLCSPDAPMPKDAAGYWAHMNVKQIQDWGDGTVEMRCNDCGKEWTKELPQ